MRPRGHTLLEVLLALALVTLLAGLAYASVGHQVRAARRAQARTALALLWNQQERYHSQHHCYLAFGGPAQAEPAASCPWLTASPASRRAPLPFPSLDGPDPALASYRLQAEPCPAPAAASAAPSLALCVQMRATPLQDDPEVGSLLLRSTGARGCTGTRPALCWP